MFKEINLRNHSSLHKLFYSLVVAAVLNISTLSICWFGAKEVVGGSLQTGQLISMFTYSNSVLFSLNILAMITTQLVISGASGQ
ncbi:hypothetical protein CEE86_10830 [Lactobacillus crispatus]|nr:hypothetical protein CEE86_10830 [Lactobacillus crispatus]